MSPDRPPDPTDEVPLPPADSGYDLPPELEGRPRRAGEAAAPTREGPDQDGGDDWEPPRLKRPIGLQIGIALAVVALAAGAILAYRSHQRSRALAEGLPKAEALLRLDSAAGYRGAADLLLPLAKLDPMEAASMRAFALAMLAADYRDAEAEPQVEALLLEPGRAEVVPAWANLASAALYLGRRSVAEATTYAGRAGRSAWAGTLQGRIAFQAGNPEAGAEAIASAVAADEGLAPALAMQGELARRLRKDPAAARAAYSAALAASPLHPRSTYGLAKLALASQIPLAQAQGPLQRLIADDPATPANERARAALLLAALSLRAGDRAAARAALDSVRDGASRGWAEVAASVMAADHRAYRAVRGAPPPYQSASDEDPPEAAPVPPAPPSPPAPAEPARKVAKKVAPAPTKRPPAAPVKKAPARKPATAKPAT
jgi:hypothetical protein